MRHKLSPRATMVVSIFGSTITSALLLGAAAAATCDLVSAAKGGRGNAGSSERGGLFSVTSETPAVGPVLSGRRARLSGLKAGVERGPDAVANVVAGTFNDNSARDWTLPYGS